MIARRKIKIQRKNLDIRPKQCIIANFRCSLNALSTTNEMHPLYYVEMKSHSPKIVYYKFEVATPKGCVVILVSFNFKVVQ